MATNPNARSESVLQGWQPIETAPRDGTRILATNGDFTQVCYPREFPRPVNSPFGADRDKSIPGDIWEYFRDDQNAPGRSWSMIPSHWMPLPPAPTGAA